MLSFIVFGFVLKDAMLLCQTDIYREMPSNAIRLKLELVIYSQLHKNSLSGNMPFSVGY